MFVCMRLYVQMRLFLHVKVTDIFFVTVSVVAVFNLVAAAGTG